MTLEDQLTEDKAHLLLKENTIETLQDGIKEKNLKLKNCKTSMTKLLKLIKMLLLRIGRA